MRPGESPRDCRRTPPELIRFVAYAALCGVFVGFCLIGVFVLTEAMPFDDAAEASYCDTLCLDGFATPQEMSACLVGCEATGTKHYTEYRVKPCSDYEEPK